jgi:hypothetical protein
LKALPQFSVIGTNENSILSHLNQNKLIKLASAAALEIKSLAIIIGTTLSLVGFTGC